jgi:hypothetical protein
MDTMVGRSKGQADGSNTPASSQSWHDRHRIKRWARDRTGIGR